MWADKTGSAHNELIMIHQLWHHVYSVTVQGGDCFGAFMQWGLPKGTLKDVWATVAGDEGYLSQQQFVQCLYLMDNAKRVGLPCAAMLFFMKMLTTAACCYRSSCRGLYAALLACHSACTTMHRP